MGSALLKLLSENRLQIQDWELLVPTLQSILNFSSTKGNGGMSPLWEFTGLEPPNPVDLFLEENNSWKRVRFTETEREVIAKRNADLAVEREIRLHDFQEQRAYSRRVQRWKQRGVKEINFGIGDYVMVHNHNNKAKHGVRFLGPAQVVSVHDGGNVFGIKFISKTNFRQDEQRVHGRFLRFFDHASMVVTPELLRQSEFFAQRRWEIDHLMDLTQVNKDWKVLVLWESGEKTWEDLETLREDVPKLLQDFIEGTSKGKDGLADRAKRCAIHMRSFNDPTFFFHRQIDKKSVKNETRFLNVHLFFYSFEISSLSLSNNRSKIMTLDIQILPLCK